jgi:hypothetical protein
MSSISYTINRPNWLGSEVGMKTITITLTTAFATTVTENGRTIVKSGTIYSDDNVKGLVFGDYDITDHDQIASLMIRGSYIDDKLPATAADSATDFKAQGLYATYVGADTIQDFGTVGITALAKPVLTDVAASTKFTWAEITGAIGYRVYKGTVLVAEVASTVKEYEYKTNAGSYTVIAVGDYVYFSDSAASTALVIA